MARKSARIADHIAPNSPGVVFDLVGNPQGRVTQRVREVGEAQVRTSIIVAAELRCGAAKRRSPRLTAQREAVPDAREVLPFKAADTAYRPQAVCWLASAAPAMLRSASRGGRPWGGPGKYRGGLGYCRTLLADQVEITGSQCSARHRVQPFALFGGMPGGNGATLIQKAGSDAWLTAKELYGKISSSKYANARFAPGDRIRLTAPGGGATAILRSATLP